MTLGERLRKLRARAGLSQNQLAKRAKVPQSVIAAVEGERQKSVSLDDAMQLATALGVPVDLLAGKEGR